MPDDTLIDLAARELALLKIVEPSQIEDGLVYRQAKAYPLYSDGYRGHLQVIRSFLATFENLQTIGRIGLRR